MTNGSSPRRLPARALIAILAVTGLAMPAGAEHSCDALGEAGWRTVATLETVEQTESKPYRAEPGGSWYVDRTTTMLPFCHYYNSLGNYSLRSYSLSPETQKVRVEICRADGAISSHPLAPYTGQCPPK